MNATKVRRRLPRSALIRPFQTFLRMEASGGIILLAAALTAVLWANSPFAASYDRVWEMPIGVSSPFYALEKPLRDWINDGLMAMFFFLVGLEIKRELLIGELSAPKKALLPLIAALGGMIVPATIYLALNAGTPAHTGWGIPMATDIAFSLGVLSLLNRRIPLGLKIFLAALAIADDLGAVIVIAIFYTGKIAWTSLGIALLLLALIALANRLHIWRPVVYAVLGGGVWITVLDSGVHATVAGVLVALLIPATRRMHRSDFVQHVRGLAEILDPHGHRAGPPTIEQRHAAHHLEMACRHVQSPLCRFENALHGYVAYLVMPLFALANAGVHLRGSTGAAANVTAGVALGLVLGKQAGVMIFARAAIGLGLARLPAGVTWRQIYGAAWLCGIGFTMSIFIATLGLGDPHALAAAKVGVFAGSILSGAVGWLLLRTTPPAG